MIMIMIKNLYSDRTIYRYSSKIPKKLIITTKTTKNSMLCENLKSLKFYTKLKLNYSKH